LLVAVAAVVYQALVQHQVVVAVRVVCVRLLVYLFRLVHQLL
jgi:hypothetical protein